MRVATDVGGTFTDLVYFDPEADPGASVVCAKVDSTPAGFDCKSSKDLGQNSWKGKRDFYVL